MMRNTIKIVLSRPEELHGKLAEAIAARGDLGELDLSKWEVLSVTDAAGALLELPSLETGGIHSARFPLEYTVAAMAGPAKLSAALCQEHFLLSPMDPSAAEPSPFVALERLSTPCLGARSANPRAAPAAAARDKEATSEQFGQRLASLDTPRSPRSARSETQRSGDNGSVDRSQQACPAELGANVPDHDIVLRYLPERLHGRTILLPLDEPNAFMVHNPDSLSESGEARRLTKWDRIVFRLSPQARDLDHGSHSVTFGDVVYGELLDGWLQMQVDVKQATSQVELKRLQRKTKEREKEHQGKLARAQHMEALVYKLHDQNEKQRKECARRQWAEEERQKESQALEYAARVVEKDEKERLLHARGMRHEQAADRVVARQQQVEAKHAISRDTRRQKDEWHCAKATNAQRYQERVRRRIEALMRAKEEARRAHQARLAKRERANDRRIREQFMSSSKQSTDFTQQFQEKEVHVRQLRQMLAEERSLSVGVRPDSPKG